MSLRSACPSGRTMRQVGLLLAACGMLAGCAQPVTSRPDRSSGSPTSASPTVLETPAPAPPPAVVFSPLTGLPLPALGQVLVVKVDNTRSARPQAGVYSADVVYVEEVEGGVTRLAAVFSSTFPPSVGPIRSARTTDIE